MILTITIWMILVYIDRVELLHGWRRHIIFMKPHQVPQLWSTTTDAEQQLIAEQRLSDSKAGKVSELHICENKIFITNIHYMYWFSNCCGHFIVIIYRITRYVPNPKMDENDPSKIIQFWMKTTHIQIWMILNSSIIGWFRSSLFGYLCTLKFIHSWMILTITIWMILVYV